MWALRRRVLIVVIIALFVAGCVGLGVLYKKATERPLCTDNKQNGSETGIDCGGACARVCRVDTRPLYVNWARVVPVTDKVYSVAIQVENRNYDALAYHATYNCNILTGDYRSVQKVSNTVSVPPAGQYSYAITSLRFASDDVRPERVTCTFDSRHEWLRLPQKTTPVPFDFQESQLDATTARPALYAVMSNTDNARTFKNMMVTAVIYDSLDTVIAASTTTVDRIEPTRSIRIFFTWPNQFGGTGPYRVEFTPVFEFPDYIKRTQ